MEAEAEGLFGKVFLYIGHVVFWKPPEPKKKQLLLVFFEDLTRET